jgi:hypothetical protein|tara:strand:- start:8288 stop:8629 length:342 start_codon:yes stop_codon:yes gene_type:complete
MKKSFQIIKLKNKKTLNDKSIYLHVLENFKKFNFTAKRIYFHDFKKNHLIKDKINNADTIFIPLSGVLYFSFGKKRISLKKNQSLLIKKNVIFDLKSSKSFFIVLANRNYKKL